MQGRVGTLKTAHRVLIVFCVVSLLPFAAVFISHNATQPRMLSLASFAPYLFRVTGQTLLLCVVVIALSLVIGVPSGYFLSRIPSRHARFFTLVLTLPLASPSLVSAILIRTLGERSGWLYTSVRALGIRLPSVYGFFGLVLTLLLHGIPYTMLIMRMGFMRIPHTIEENAYSLGASSSQVFYSVLLPYVMPQVLTAAIMVLMYTLGDLGAPLIVGGGYKVFASEIYTNFISNWGDQRIPVVFAFWTVLVFSAILIVLVRVQKASEPRPQYSNALFRFGVSGHRHILGYLFQSGVTLLLLVPFGAVLLQGRGSQVVSLQVFASLDTAPMRTTVIAAFYAVPLMLLSGVLIAHALKGLRRKGFYMGVVLAPAVLPGVLLGFGLLNGLYAIPRIAHTTPYLVGTLVLALILRGLPYVIIVLQAAINPANIPLEDTAQSLGARPLFAFLQVTLPQVRPFIGVAAVVGFFSCVTELAASLVIYPPGWQTMSMYIAYYMEEGFVARAVAMALVLLVVVEATLAVASAGFRRLSLRTGENMLGSTNQSVLLSAFTALQPEAKEAKAQGALWHGFSKQRVLLFLRGLNRTVTMAFVAGFFQKKTQQVQRGTPGLLAQISSLEAENKELRRALALSEQTSLRMQINPHFFFNTLNTIVSLVQRHPQAAAETIGKLSLLFRYTLDASEEPLMYLPKEIEYIRTYLEIEKLRFGNTLQFSIDVPDELYSLSIPPMLMQPLVENAIRYGKDADHNAYVHISARKAKGFLYIDIADYGVFSGDLNALQDSHGTGITNIKKRLALLNAGSLVFMRNTPRGLIARLCLAVDS